MPIHPSSIDPTPSSLDFFTWPIQVKGAFGRLWTAVKTNDDESFLDNLIIFFQKPLSAIYTTANTYLLGREAFAFFNSSIKTIVPLVQATAGLGSFLAITQIFLEVVGLKRVITFDREFISSPAPQQDDLKSIKAWAKKTGQIVEKMEARESRSPQNPQDRSAELTRIKNLCAEIESLPDQAPFADKKKKLDLLIKRRDLQTLHSYFSQSGKVSEEKLYRRVGFLFVKNNREKLQEALKELNDIVMREYPNSTEDFSLTGPFGLLHESKSSPDLSAPDLGESHSKALSSAEEILNAREIQSTKRKIVHTLGIIAGCLLLTGFILSIFFPPIGLALIILGTVINLVRFVFWAGFSESEGWKFEFGKWVDLKVTEASTALKSLKSSLSEKLLEPIGGKISDIYPQYKSSKNSDIFVDLFEWITFHRS